MPVSSEFRRIYARSAARRKPAPAPCWCGGGHAVKAGHSPTEWKAMSPPDPSTQPGRHRQWLAWSTHEEKPVTIQPNPDRIQQWGEHTAALTPAIVRIVDRYRRRAAKIARNPDLAADTKHSLLDLARKDASSDLAPLRARFDSAKEAVNEATAQAFQPRALDAASEQRVTRAWTRVEKILDRAPAGDRDTIIEQQLARAKATGDETTLRALWEGVPGYLESDARDDRGRQEAARVRDYLVEVAAPEETVRAHEQRKSFDAGSYRVGISLSEAENVLSGGDTAGVFPGYRNDELHELAAETPAEVAESGEARLRSLMP